MYLIFNAYGHLEYTQPQAPRDLPDGFFGLEGSIIVSTPFAWSDGNHIFYSNEPPPNEHYQLKNGKWVLPQSEQSHALQVKKAELVQRSAEKADQLKNQILVGYPQAEIDSFYRQEKEALAYQADPQANVPMLRAIAEQRGISLDELVGKVLEKAAIFAAVMGQIIGTRQAFEDSILLAKNQQDLTRCEQEIEQWQLSI